MPRKPTSLAPCLFRHRYFYLPTSPAPPLKLIWSFICACQCITIDRASLHMFATFRKCSWEEISCRSAWLCRSQPWKQAPTSSRTDGSGGNGTTPNLETRTAVSRSSPPCARRKISTVAASYSTGLRMNSDEGRVDAKHCASTSSYPGRNRTRDVACA